MIEAIDISKRVITSFCLSTIIVFMILPLQAMAQIGTCSRDQGPTGVGPMQGTVFIPNYDVNKTGSWPFNTDPITGDSKLCWAASAADILAYDNWGTGGTSNDANAIFQELNSHYPNTGGFPVGAWQYYLSTNHSITDISPYYRDVTNTSTMPSSIDNILGSGYGASLLIKGTTDPNMYHAITAWGTDRNPSTGQYTAVLVTDSDDALNGVQKYNIEQSGNRWLMTDYYGRPWIDEIQALAPRVGQPITFVDTRTDQVPYILDQLATFIKGFYTADPKETGVTDAPIVGLNGRVLTEADTGQDGLHYTAGPAVEDKIPGNGIDDLVAFSLSFPSFDIIDSAFLNINLTPKSSAITTDLLFFADNMSTSADNLGNALLDKLLVDVTTDVIFDLSAMPSSHGLLDLRNLVLDGNLDVLYGDDSLIHWVSLTVWTLDKSNGRIKKSFSLVKLRMLSTKNQGD